ncbi:MAG TPA: hypothetical protein VGO86_05960 [Candidatus Dormibacteraeota bacterium]
MPLAFVVALGGAACSSPASHVPAAPGASTAPAAGTPDVVRAHTVCFAGPPAGWSRSFADHSLGVSGGLGFDVGAVSEDGGMAFGHYRSATEQGVGAVALAGGALSRIAPLPAGAAGIGSMSAAGPWVVWEQAESSTDLGDWSVRAWSRDTTEALVLATSHLPDGGSAFGEMPLPVVRRGVVAWAQPQARHTSHPEATVQLYDLGRRRATVLDTGRVSGPVFAGPYVVWARVAADESFSLRAVDAVTLRPAPLPDRARSPGSVRYLAGSARYLAWSSGQQRLTVWRLGSNEYDEYTTDLRHPLQFLQLAGDFVLWYAGYPSSVLDLRTGRAFDVRGSVAGSDALIALSEPARPPATKTEIVPARLSYAPLSAATRIDSC